MPVTFNFQNLKNEEYMTNVNYIDDSIDKKIEEDVKEI
jgi:hypothetical protein